jgi:Na+/H+ antiporter NhaD/arsenite permease-like protein
VELDVVFRGRFQHFFQRSICPRRGKMDRHFANPALMWKVLVLATTFAGNLTIISSVANMIVVESAREHIEVGS